MQRILYSHGHKCFVHLKKPRFFSSTLPLQIILHGHNMSKTVQIAIKKLQDPKGSKSEIKKMKLSAIFYLTQLGFSQYDISNMIDMKRTTVEGAVLN